MNALVITWASVCLWLLPATTAQEDTPRVSSRGSVSQSVETFLAERLREGQERFRQGHFYSAFRIADAILVLAPDISFRAEAKRLRRRAEARYLGDRILTVHFELDASRNSFPLDVVHGSLVLENVSTSTVQVGEPEKAGILGLAEFEVLEFYLDTQISNQGSRVVALDQGLELEPGASHRVAVELEVLRGPGVPVMQALRMQGTLRPSVLKVAGRAVARGIPWQGTLHVLLPDDLQAVPREPYRHLQRALLEREPRRLIVATRLWRQRLQEGGELAAPLRERTVDLLLDSLSAAQDFIDRLIIQELAALTGESRAATVDSWRIWKLEREAEKRRRRGRSGRVRTPRGGGGGG